MRICFEDEGFVLPHRMFAPTVGLNTGTAHLITQAQLHRREDPAELSHDTKLLFYQHNMRGNRQEGGEKHQRIEHRVISEPFAKRGPWHRTLRSTALPTITCAVVYHGDKKKLFRKEDIGRAYESQLVNHLSV